MMRGLRKDLAVAKGVRAELPGQCKCSGGLRPYKKLANDKCLSQGQQDMCTKLVVPQACDAYAHTQKHGLTTAEPPVSCASLLAAFQHHFAEIPCCITDK